MTRIALVQQQAGVDKTANVERGVSCALEAAAANGAEVVCFSELAFEPFYPQCRAQRGYKQLAEPVPGPTTERFAGPRRATRAIVVVLQPSLRSPPATGATDTSPVIDADAPCSAGCGWSTSPTIRRSTSRITMRQATPRSRVSHALWAGRRRHLLRPALSRVHEGTRAWRRRAGSRAPGGHRRRMARRAVRGRDARGGIPERLLHWTVQPRGR